MKKTFALALILLILGSCTALKKLKNVTQGDVTEKKYFQEIPFEYYQDLIFIKVSINNKEYNFLFDTGWDLTAISNRIIDNLDYTKSNVSGVSNDAADKNKDFEYLTLNNLKIGKINFNNIGVFADDFTHYSKVLGCLGGFDGIIGNNLIRKAKWQIDYKNKVIRISDNVEKFSIDKNSFSIPLKTKNYGHAYINVKLNGTKEYFTFDTGYNGKFQSNRKLFNILNSEQNLEYTVKTGFSGIQANGETKGKTFQTIIENFNVAEIELDNQLVNFKESASSLIGNDFFESFIITIDWKEKVIFLDRLTEIKKDTLSVYQLLFAPNYVTNKIEFYNEWVEHSLNEPVNTNATILSINNIDVSNFTTEELCHFWDKNSSKLLTETVQMEISENGNKREIVLTKKQLLPK